MQYKCGDGYNFGRALGSLIKNYPKVVVRLVGLTYYQLEPFDVEKVILERTTCNFLLGERRVEMFPNMTNLTIDEPFDSRCLVKELKLIHLTHLTINLANPSIGQDLVPILKQPSATVRILNKPLDKINLVELVKVSEGVELCILCVGNGKAVIETMKNATVNFERVKLVFGICDSDKLDQKDYAGNEIAYEVPAESSNLCSELRDFYQLLNEDDENVEEPVIRFLSLWSAITQNDGHVQTLTYKV